MTRSVSSLILPVVTPSRATTGFMLFMGGSIFLEWGNFDHDVSTNTDTLQPNTSAPKAPRAGADQRVNDTPPHWPGCGVDRIAPRKGVEIKVLNQYLNDGVSCALMGAWFKFDTFGHELVISLDTEYQSAGAYNDIVSYQVLAVSTQGRAIELLFYCDAGSRMALSEIIEVTRKLLGIKPSTLKFSQARSPAPILLLSHFGAAEWAAVRDRSKLGSVLQNIRKVPVSLGTVAFEVNMSNRLVVCGLKVADTTLLAPAGKGSLAALGEVVGIPKLALPQGAITRMREYLGEDPGMFASYGINDCRITYAYYARMHDLAKNTLGLANMPLTLGGFGVAGFRQHVGQLPLLKFLGLEKTKGFRKTSIEKSHSREVADAFFGPAFSGGLNVSVEGRFNNTLIMDLDFRSCYPSAAATLPVLDWEASFSQTDLGQLSDDVSDMITAYRASPVALASVTFRFPEDCRWPCIPIRCGSRGLIYPLYGTGYATTFELTEALRKGAVIDIHRMVHLQPVYRDDSSPQLMFAAYLAQLIDRRRQHPNGSLENLMFKEMANSFYGKLAQGVRARRVRSFDSLTTLPESPITSPAHAGAVTGIVRAALIGLIDSIEECGGTVLAATTDGAMASFPHLAHLPRPVTLCDVPGLLDAAMAKPAIRALAAGLSNMSITDPPIEIKHVGDQAIVWKTRGYIILDGGTVQHLARAGHRGSAADLIGYDRDDSGASRWTLQRLSSVQSIWDGKQQDLISLFEDRRVNLDFDYKRIPSVDGAFRPPVDIAEFEEWREKMESIRKSGERATISKVRMSMSGIKLQGGEVEALKRQLLRAVAQDVGGLFPRDLDGNRLTQKSLADRLGVTIMDIKNAKRRSFSKLPHTSVAEEVVQEVLEALYPGGQHVDREKIDREIFGAV